MPAFSRSFRMDSGPGIINLNWTGISEIGLPSESSSSSVTDRRDLKPAGDSLPSCMTTLSAIQQIKFD